MEKKEVRKIELSILEARSEDPTLTEEERKMYDEEIIKRSLVFLLPVPIFILHVIAGIKTIFIIEGIRRILIILVIAIVLGTLYGILEIVMIDLESIIRSGVKWEVPKVCYYIIMLLLVAYCLLLCWYITYF